MVDFITAGKKALNAAKTPLLGVALPLVIGTIVVVGFTAIFFKN